MRAADTLHAFGFEYTRCFRAAVLLEMTRTWRAARADSATAPDRNVTQHWLHKVGYSLRTVLRGRHTYLLDNGTFE